MGSSVADDEVADEASFASPAKPSSQTSFYCRDSTVLISLSCVEYAPPSMLNEPIDYLVVPTLRR